MPPFSDTNEAEANNGDKPGHQHEVREPLRNHRPSAESAEATRRMSDAEIAAYTEKVKRENPNLMARLAEND